MERIVELLQENGFKPDFKAVKELVSKLENLKKWARLKGFQIYKGTRSFPKIVVNPYTDASFWDWKKNFINIGILTYGAKTQTAISLKNLTLSLLGHELSHTENTPIPKEEWNQGLMTVFNILEDQRIETLMAERIGKELFEKNNTRYYELYYQREPENHLNPYNIVILKRWERWGVKIQWDHLKKAEGKLKKALEKGFLEDAENTLILMETADREMAIILTEEFYKRWEWLFESKHFQSSVIDPLGGKGEIEGYDELPEEAKEEVDRQLEEIENQNPFKSKNPSLPSYKRSQWLNEYYRIYYPEKKEVEKWKKELKNLFTKKRKERSWIGNKIDPRIVITGIPKPPAWRKKEKHTKEKVAIIIDGSASMEGKFQKAVNIAQAIRELSSNVVIFITTSEGLLKIKNKAYPFPHGGTALTVAKPYLTNYKIVAITDGYVDREEKEFLKQIEKQKGFVFLV